MKYFPLSSSTFQHQFGVRAIEKGESIVECTDQYEAEIALKRGALDAHESYYFQATDDSLVSQRDVVDVVVEASDFVSHGQNLRSGESIEIDETCPLLGISRHFQEDLTILQNDADRGFPLIAGSVCFPSGWCIGEKLLGSILTVHTPVPEFATALSDPTHRLMNQLKIGRPVWRTNWGIRSSGQLDQSPRHRRWLQEQTRRITPRNAADRCFFRVERQTLARLPSRGDILFAIHTRQRPIGELDTLQRSRLLGVIRTCPDETLRYKGILPMKDAIVRSLESSLN